MFNWNNFSGSLLARSVYLITIPIVLVQIVGIIIFFELHWDLVLKRNAQAITNEIKILELNQNSSEINLLANTLQIVRSEEFDASEIENISNWIFNKRINQSLSQIAPNFKAYQNKTYFIFFDEQDPKYYYLVPRKRIELKSVSGFFYGQSQLV